MSLYFPCTSYLLFFLLTPSSISFLQSSPNPLITPIFIFSQVEHCFNKSKVVMTPGMVFTIEPILVEGGSRISVWEDGWTAATFDGGRCVVLNTICIIFMMTFKKEIRLIELNYNQTSFFIIFCFFYFVRTFQGGTI